MRVIFLEDVPGSGLAGEIKNVKNGYGRNFLIPRNLAVVATHDHLQRVESIRKTGEERRLREEKDIQVLAELLAQLIVTITAKVGPLGRLYGTVTSTHIAEELSRLSGRSIDRRNVHLADPIHEPGVYQTNISLGYGVSTDVQVTVRAEGEIQEQEQPEAEKQRDSQGEVDGNDEEQINNAEEME